jgi:YegS/Rv2252/BmrU family lipid kinase
VNHLEKVLLFYNPYSGNGVFKNNLDKVIERFQKKNTLVIPVRADRAGKLDDFFKTYKVNTFKKIIAAGGDGTINIVVNAMINNDILIPLTIFPSGTANDFAYYFDLPTDIDDMLRIATDDYFTYADVGYANETAFVNVMALGMLVDISQKTDPVAKNTLGVFSYYLKGITELPKMKPIPIKVTSDEQEIETDMLFMLVMNGRSAGGFNNIAPKSEINDGLFDVIIFKDMPFVELPPLFFSVMTGQHEDHKKVISFKTSRLRIESSQELVTDVDGETGPELPVDIQVLHNRLKINTYTNNVKRVTW